MFSYLMILLYFKLFYLYMYFMLVLFFIHQSNATKSSVLYLWRTFSIVCLARSIVKRAAEGRRKQCGAHPTSIRRTTLTSAPRTRPALLSSSYKKYISLFANIVFCIYELHRLLLVVMIQFQVIISKVFKTSFLCLQWTKNIKFGSGENKHIAEGTSRRRGASGRVGYGHFSRGPTFAAP